MARSKGGGGSPRPNSGSGNAARQNNSSGSATPKGQVRSGKEVQYAIKDSTGNLTYIGTTNNPRRRAAEHRASGTLGSGDKLVIQTKAVSPSTAGKVEAAKLAAHRQTHGSNPKNNTTKDGKYHE